MSYFIVSGTVDVVETVAAPEAESHESCDNCSIAWDAGQYDKVWSE
jgi:hypothetical protein